MAAWQTSSLAFSDSPVKRHGGSGLLKNLHTRISKQHLSEQKMFGSKRGKTGKSLKIGKTFKKSGKGIMHGSFSSEHTSKKQSGISPSLEEFDKMMANVLGKKSNGNGNGKKSTFSRKQFG